MLIYQPRKLIEGAPLSRCPLCSGRVRAHHAYLPHLRRWYAWTVHCDHRPRHGRQAVVWTLGGDRFAPDTAINRARAWVRKLGISFANWRARP